MGLNHGWSIKISHAICCCSVTKSCLTLCNLMDCSTPGFVTLWLSFTISWNLLKLMYIESVMPSNHLILCCHLFPLPSIFPSIRVFSSESTLCFKVLELQLQHLSFQWIFRVDFLWDWLIRSPCSPRDSRESYPATQFENINSLVLSLLYGSALTSIHDYWENHSFD